VFLTLDETRKLLDTAKLPRDVALLWCLAYGLRIAEATALKIGDVTAPNGNGMGSLMVRGKGNKARTLPISAQAYGATSSYVSAVPMVLFSMFWMAVGQSVEERYRSGSRSWRGKQEYPQRRGIPIVCDMFSLPGCCSIPRRLAVSTPCPIC